MARPLCPESNLLVEELVERPIQAISSRSGSYRGRRLGPDVLSKHHNGQPITISETAQYSNRAIGDRRSIILDYERAEWRPQTPEGAMDNADPYNGVRLRPLQAWCNLPCRSSIQEMPSL